MDCFTIRRQGTKLENEMKGPVVKSDVVKKPAALPINEFPIEYYEESLVMVRKMCAVDKDSELLSRIIDTALYIWANVPNQQKALKRMSVDRKQALCFMAFLATYAVTINRERSKELD